MMNGPEKSDPVIVAGKPTNKAGRSAAELVEPRAGTKGNASQPSTCWTQSQISVSQDVGLHTAIYCRHYPRWEKLWGGRRRSWHLHRPHELMEVAPWPKSMILAEA
jgi:hypothetical protein